MWRISQRVEWLILHGWTDLLPNCATATIQKLKKVQTGMDPYIIGFLMKTSISIYVNLTITIRESFKNFLKFITIYSGMAMLKLVLLVEAEEKLRFWYIFVIQLIQKNLTFPKYL